MSMYHCEMCGSLKDGDYDCPTEFGDMDMVCEDCACNTCEVDDLVVECNIVNPPKKELALEVKLDSEFASLSSVYKDEMQYTIKKGLINQGLPEDGTGWQASWSGKSVHISIYDEYATMFELKGGTTVLANYIRENALF